MAQTIRDIMLDVLFFQLLICAIIIAFDLFTMESASTSYLHLIVSFTEMASTVVPCYIYCSLSETFTFELVEIGDTFYSSLWYEMPVTYQKLMQMPVMRSQREVRLSGLGLINCSLSVFLSVWKHNIIGQWSPSFSNNDNKSFLSVDSNGQLVFYSYA